MSRSPITAHILDTSKGKPAANVQLKLFHQVSEGKWSSVASGKTNENGRCDDLQVGEPLSAGLYKIFFDTAPYFSRMNQTTFYPYIEVVFNISSPSEHYHVPLLLSPFGYTTYRGS